MRLEDGHCARGIRFKGMEMELSPWYCDVAGQRRLADLE